MGADVLRDEIEGRDVDVGANVGVNVNVDVDVDVDLGLRFWCGCGCGVSRVAIAASEPPRPSSLLAVARYLVYPAFSAHQLLQPTPASAPGHSLFRCAAVALNGAL